MSYRVSPFHLQHYCAMVVVIITTAAIDQYYQSVIHSLTMSANTCVPVKKSGYQKHWWSDELDDLKQETIEATNFWRSAGCPRSGIVNNNRLQI